MASGLKDDELFRSSLKDEHDEHVADNYWHDECSKCDDEKLDLPVEMNSPDKS